MDMPKAETAARTSKSEVVRTPRTASIPEIFGRLTFNKKTMAERLSRTVYDRLIDTIENNEPLDREIADEVATAMKDWAVGLGATHFCHWFQPLRGETAEKHDSFIGLENGVAIESFSGKQLTQGEPDASSFPSGGMRSTFEARGYTAWDPTSPAYVLKTGRSATLVIPCVYMSFTGEVLDRKTPFLRALRTLEDRALNVLKRFGNRTARHVRVTLGPEQEYFLVAKELYLQRPDLVYTGRTLVGQPSAKHQQMEDHYFGAIKPQVLNFMADVETALFERGIPAKTRHNEVAPNQFELAVLYEEGNLAVDHNLQAMEIMRKVADEHGLAILLHEKPFAGINGSGKHLNWSLADSDGHNLLQPGSQPKLNIQFLFFLAAILKGAEKYGALLRTAVADAGNDHRLGANEAPPAIMSVYLGEFLDALLTEIEKGKTKGESLAVAVDHGLKQLPAIVRDNSDRNRTSPIAFTGDKFEFRAVGASASTSEPALMLCLATAWGIDEMLRKVDKLGAGADIAEAAMDAIREAVKETSKVRFEGNGYSADWHKEAAKRGLPNLKNTPAALETLLDPGVAALFEKYKVLTKQELHALYEIKLEAYAKTKEIELRLIKELAATFVAPAVTRNVSQLGGALAAAKQAKAGGAYYSQKIREGDAILKDIAAGVAAVQSVLEKAESEKDAAKKAGLLADKGAEALETLRTACDKAEATTDQSLWPLPKYRQLLFIL